MFGLLVRRYLSFHYLATLYSHVMSILNPSTSEEYANGDTSMLMSEVLNREKSALIIPVYEYMRACGSFKSCVREYDD